MTFAEHESNILYFKVMIVLQSFNVNNGEVVEKKT